MVCPNCGIEQTSTEKFCSSCGHHIQESAEISSVNDTTQPTYDPTLNTPKKRRNRGFVIGAAAVVVVLGGGFGAAAAAHAFASPKSLLLLASQNQQGSGTVPSTQQTWHLKLKNLNVAGLPQPAAGLADTLNNASIDGTLALYPQSKRLELDFSTQYQSVSHKGALWLTPDTLILSAKDYQALLAPILPGVALPQYLVTDGSQSKGIKDFWAQMSQNSGQLTPQQTAAVHNLQKLLISAIPDQYIQRTGLATIEIDFDNQGLQDILKSEVRTIYQNKQQFADTLSQLSATARPSGTSTSDMKQQILQGIDQTPEETILAGISTTFDSGTVYAEPIKITLSKQVFGKRMTEHVTGGVAVRDPQSGDSATLEFTVDANSPATTGLQLPSVSGANSQTFSNWIAKTPSGSTN